MAKKINIDWKALGVKYGDKLGIGLAAFFAVLLLLYAGMWSAPSITPEVVQKQESNTRDAIMTFPVETARLQPVGVKPLEDIQTLSKTMRDPVGLDWLETAYPWYYDIPADSNFKQNPTVRGATRLVAAAINLPYRVYEFNDKGEISISKDLKVKEKTNNQNNLRGSAGGGPSVGSGAGLGSGAGIGSGSGNRGGNRPPAPGRPGMGGGSGGGGPAGVGGPGGGSGGDTTGSLHQRIWKLIKDVTDEDALAEQLLPARGVLIVGAFPHNSQVKEIAEALMKDVKDVESLYDGIEVQRREVVVKGTRLEDGTVATQDLVYVPDAEKGGKVLVPLAQINEKYPNPIDDKEMAAAGWETVDPQRVAKLLKPIPPSYYAENDPILKSLILISDRLVMKLPTPVRGILYPELYRQLPEIMATIDAIEKEKKSHIAPPKRDPRLGDKDDLFGEPTKGGDGAEGGGGGNRTGGGAGPAGLGGGSGGGVAGVGGGSGPGAAGGGGSDSKTAFTPDYCFIRFLDLTLDANQVNGRAFEYRVKVRLINPNYQRPLEVADPNLAKWEKLYGPWSPVARAVFPNDTYVYVNERLRDSQRQRPTASDEDTDKVWVQVHHWLGIVNADGMTDPFQRIGAWWVDKVLVGRGEYIGRYLQYPYAERLSKKIPLPSNENKLIAWSAVDPDANRGNKPGIDKEAKFKTLDLLTHIMLVDFQGGHRMRLVDPFSRSKATTRDVPAEILLVEPNGRMTAHNLTSDNKDTVRKERADAFEKWYKSVAEVKREDDKKKENKDKN